MLRRMKHRGACGCDETSGDGAGILTGIPHKLYARLLRYRWFALKVDTVLAAVDSAKPVQPTGTALLLAPFKFLDLYYENEKT